MHRDQCVIMAEYNRWMNQRLYALCADLPDTERKRDRGAFFKSIHGTLNHLLWGDRAWLARFLGKDYGLPKVGVPMYEAFDEMRRERAETDAEILAWARTLDAERLAAPFTYTSGIHGRTRTLPLWVLATHLFNHQTHHRGQLTTLMMQAGVDPGETDLPWLPALYPAYGAID